MKADDMIKIVEKVVEGVANCLGVEIENLKADVSKILNQTDNQVEKTQKIERAIDHLSHRVERVETRCDQHDAEIKTINSFLETIKTAIAKFETALKEILKNVKYKKTILTLAFTSPVIISIISNWKIIVDALKAKGGP